MKERIGFASYPDFSGNSKALFEDMVKNNSNYELIWFCKDKKNAEKLNNIGINAICDKDEGFIEEFNKTKIIINTHDYYMDIKKDYQVFINLWHGLGPKKIGTLADIELDWIYKFSMKNDYLIANGELGRVIFPAIFNKPIEYVKQFSQPRYKWLFENKGKENLQKLLNIDVKKYNKILMYAPTFKKGIGREDSKFNENNILNLNEYDESVLNDYLEKNNILLLLKLHPVEESNLKVIDSNNIIKLSDEIMLDSFITINELLDGVDLLISDYSSIYIDYINLERPVLFLDTDKTEYEKNRGIIFDSLDFWWMAGPKVHDINSFVYEVDKLFNETSYYREERKTFNKLVNGTIDKTNEKLIDFINNIKSKDKKIENNYGISLLEKKNDLLSAKINDMQKLLDKYKNETVIKQEEINNYSKELEYVKKEYEIIYKELESIKYSRSYRIIQKLKKIKSKNKNMER
ncbi:MAG: CDP-glycerol glycerophosphotransferase family protein [Clostridia bacterium]|nr:CDP-glycerol glycerophosphotransferase family protein [Clostridia bacterium]